jgi:hypothetical protein
MSKVPQPLPENKKSWYALSALIADTNHLIRWVKESEIGSLPPDQMEELDSIIGALKKLRISME